MEITTFVILKHTRNSTDLETFLRCYDSLLQYHPDIPIVIVDDNSPYKDLPDRIKDCKIIHSEFPAAGEVLPYYYYLKYRWSDKIIFLHDSMFLLKKLDNSIFDNDFKFLWHFETHKHDMDNRTINIMEKAKLPSELITYFKSKELWWGCFGIASIISYAKLKLLEDKYKLFDSLVHLIKCRQDRMSMERIFAVVCFYENFVNKKNTSFFGNICKTRMNLSYEKMLPLFSKYNHPIAKTYYGR